MKIQFEKDGLVVLESALFRTTSTLLFAEDYVLLVDPNWLPIEIDFIVELINKRGADKKKYLLFTHSDYDHIIAYGKFKDFETIASQNFVDNPKAADILELIRLFDDENYIKRDYEIAYPSIKFSIDKDDYAHCLMEDVYVFYQAKGHNSDGLISFNRSQGILIVGDYLSNIEFPYIYESVKEYKQTLGKLAHIIETENVKILIPGHGDYCTDKKEMLLRIKESYDYISELETSVVKGKAFDFERLFNRYQFPSIMKKFHKGNVALLQKETGI